MKAWVLGSKGIKALLLAQVDFWSLVWQAGPLPQTVEVFLVLASLLSWTIIFSKWFLFRRARSSNHSFLRAFRKADEIKTVAMAVEQFPLAPLVSVFEFGYEEVDRQLKKRGTLSNKHAIERALQLGVSEELTKLERNMNWLASVAAISPFVGLLGTVFGIINAFISLSSAGSASLRAVGPGIGEALITTAMGLAAAIPAAIAYNIFAHSIRELGARMDDFSLEFLNMAERTFGD